jgi:hypothetical protein
MKPSMPARRGSRWAGIILSAIRRRAPMPASMDLSQIAALAAAHLAHDWLALHAAALRD